MLFLWTAGLSSPFSSQGFFGGGSCQYDPIYQLGLVLLAPSLIALRGLPFVLFWSVGFVILIPAVCLWTNVV